MSNREIVIDLLGKLPEDTSLEEFARQIALLAGIRSAREQSRRGQGVAAEDARKLVDRRAAREQVRTRQKQEQARLRRQFAELDAADGSNDPEPAAVLEIVRQVKKERRAA